MRLDALETETLANANVDDISTDDEGGMLDDEDKMSVYEDEMSDYKDGIVDDNDEDKMSVECLDLPNLME